jgi:hypothetical protein
MNPTDRNRRELLEELFSPGLESAPAANDVIEAIQREKKLRYDCRLSLTLAGCVVVLAGLAMLPFHRAASVPLANRGQTLIVGATGSGRLASEPFQVERVDDEGLLELLDETPSALVQWPDGRCAFMQVVQTSVPR